MDAEQLKTLMTSLIWAFFALGVLLLTTPLFLRRASISRVVKNIRASHTDEVDTEHVRGAALEVLRTTAWLRHPATVFERVWRSAVPRERTTAVGAPPLSHYLAPQRMLPRLANRRLASALPGVLVALGILGTFLGLVQSLPAIGSSTSAEGSQQFQQLVDNVVEGMGLAFQTSIWGISLSVLFILIDRIGVDRLERAVIELSDAIAERFPVMSDAEVAREEFDLLQETSQNIQTLGTDLASALESALEAHMQPAMQAIQVSVDRLVSFSADEQVAGLQGLVEQFTASMNEALGSQFEELQDILTSTVRSQQDIDKGLKDFGSTIRASAEVQRTLIQETSRAAETLSGSLDRLELISGLGLD